MVEKELKYGPKRRICSQFIGSPTGFQEVRFNCTKFICSEKKQLTILEDLVLPVL